MLVSQNETMPERGFLNIDLEVCTSTERLCYNCKSNSAVAGSALTDPIKRQTTRYVMTAAVTLLSDTSGVA